MSDTAADTQVLSGLKVWWQSQPPRTQELFEKMYKRDPAMVMDVLSDGQMQPRPGLGLDQLLTIRADAQGNLQEADPQNAFPRIVVLQPPSVDPFTPAEGQQVTVSWSETNEGADSPGHLSTVGWWLTDHWGDQIQEVICDPMTRGQTVQHSVTMSGVPAGDWQIFVTANADGAQDTTAPPTAAGFGMMNAVQVRVGGGDPSNRPSSPTSANFTGWSDAIAFLSQAVGALGSDNALSATAQALYSFAGSLDSGGMADRETGETSDADSIACVQRAQAIEAKVGSVEWNSELSNSLQNELIAAIDALGAVTDPSQGAASAVAAMRAIGRGSLELG